MVHFGAHRHGSASTASGSISTHVGNVGDLAEIFVGFGGPAALYLMVDGYTMARSGKIRIVARAEIGIAARRIGALAAVKDALTA